MTPAGSEVQPPAADGPARHGFTNAVVSVFLHSNLSIILILLAVLLGVAALLATPREEDPQIVVPLADVHVRFPGHTAAEVEQLVAAPLERILYQIDGVEYVYSLSRADEAVITVRFYVGEDRERSLVKLFKRINEHLDLVPPGVAGWVVKPVEIDDVPIVTLALTGAGGDEYALRRVAEEVVERLAAVPNVSRASVIGGRPRSVMVYLDAERMEAFGVGPLEIRAALAGTDVHRAAGDYTRGDALIRVEAGRRFAAAADLHDLVVAVTGDRPVLLKDVATVSDGPREAESYVRHGWGPAADFGHEPDRPGAVVGGDGARRGGAGEDSAPAVTIALAKKKGSNAVWVARDLLAAAERLRREVIPDDMTLVVTRNTGLTADEKVNELVEALGVALVIVIALLTVGLGWREALIVALAVPVVFGLTLAVNLLAGFSINRVTLFALILSLGLLVDDPIVDVENIARHFSLRRRASRGIVLEAVAEIRPPLITATLAVIVSFLPMFFITGMMGPYMRPMALNVPVAMLMSMLVAFTITPWLAYQVLRRRHPAEAPAHDAGADGAPQAPAGPGPDEHAADLAALKATPLYRLFYPLMAPLLRRRRAAWMFLAVIGLLTLAAAGLAATRHVPLKMLPFDNKNELALVLDFDEGTTLERADAAVRDFELVLRRVPEVTDYTAYVGVPAPMDFNGLVRHYYLRQAAHLAEIRVNLVPRKNRSMQSHAIGLRLRDELTALATRHAARLKIVETPPGPPVIATLVAEVRGRPDHAYDDLVAAARLVGRRLAREPGVVDVDDTVEARPPRQVWTLDQEKAALGRVSAALAAETVALALGGQDVATIREPAERHPLAVTLRLPRAQRSSESDLSRLAVRGADGALVPLAEIGTWTSAPSDQTIYHKNLERVAYVLADTAGRPPAECVVDVQADWREAHAADGAPPAQPPPGGWVSDAPPRPVGGRTYLASGGGIPWSTPPGIRVDFAGEGEWKITLDVFRDLGLAFGAAVVGIHVLLVAQTGSFLIPVVVMLAIPLSAMGILPGFWFLSALVGGTVGGYADPVFFTATGMIGMIALAGIVTRDAIILVDFIHLSLRRGRGLFDAIMESRVVRLRPILLTAATAMLSAVPITLDPIFSGLAWSLIFGLFASTLFTLFVIPVAYWLAYERQPGHGLAASADA